MRIALLTTVAMFAFAGNSLLCRLALKGTAIDASTFTLVRITSAALALWLINRTRAGERAGGGSWYSALALFVYAAGFSLAYLRLSAGTGALLLFAAVQSTMITYRLFTGERLRMRQWAGMLLALAGLTWLVLPGLAAPPLMSSVLMLGAGVAWGIYSLRGRGSADPAATTTGNFLRAVPFATMLSLATVGSFSFDTAGR
jgi:drug/metabolite transporter (DMT)-like permease